MARMLSYAKKDGGEYFKDEAVQWKLKTTWKDLANFKTFFVARDGVI